MNDPVVSVGLPVFNGERYLSKAIESVLGQTYRNFELIVSDNASTDRTESICRNYARKDARIRYIRQPTNCGAIENHRRVFLDSRGKYFKWIAHDDSCRPEFLARCVREFLEAPGNIVLVCPRAELLNDQGDVVGVDSESVVSCDPRPYRRASSVIWHVNIAWAQYGLIRSDVLRRTRLLDTFIGSDYVLLAELAMLGKFVELSEPLLQKRIHSGASNVAHETRVRWLAWLKGSEGNSGYAWPPWLRIGWECGKSSARLELGITDKLLCAIAVPTVWYLRKSYQFASDWGQQLVHHKQIRKQQ